MTRWFRVIAYVLTLRCEEADRLRTMWSAGEELTRSQRVGEALHRSLCRSCRRARRQLLVLQDLLDDLTADGESMDPETRDAIRLAIENDEKN